MRGPYHAKTWGNTFQAEAKENTGPMWWHTLGLPALRRLRQEDYKFKASLDFIVSSRPAWARLCFNPHPQHNPKEENKKVLKHTGNGLGMVAGQSDWRRRKKRELYGRNDRVQVRTQYPGIGGTSHSL
jgi:hypothetical protein